MGFTVAASFQSRRLDVTIALSTGTYDDQANGPDTVTLKDLRVEFEAQYAGQAQLGSAHLRVFGMSQALMNRLTTLSWHPLQFPNNTIRVDAGTSDADMATVYSGTIINAQPDYDGAPEVAMILEAQVGFYNRLKAVPSQSFPGAVSITVMMQALASALNATFENNGVTGTLTDMYCPGTLIDQIQYIADAARIDYYYDGATLAICPKGQPRTSQEVIYLSEDTGLVGWPQIDKQGVGFTSLYNPAIRHGGQIQLATSITRAAGMWFVYAMAHRLYSQVPGGPWYTHISASESGNVIRNS
jgi:hypothetical protein